jgi:zinc protease
MSARHIYSVFLGLLLCQVTIANALPQASREVLPNGMIYLHVEQRALPLVTVLISLPAGTLAETAQQAGLASLTAALLQEGTTTHSGTELAQAIDTLGGQIGFDADRDAATGYLTVVRADLKAGLRLLADMVRHPTFPQAEVARQVKEAIGQIQRSRQEPATQVQVAFREALYGKHPYGRRVMGSVSTLPSLSRQDVSRFHRDYYRPEGAIVVMVGDVTQEAGKKLLQEALAGWTGAPQPFPEHPEISFPDTLEVVKLDREVSQAHIRFGHPGIERNHPDYYAVEVMNYMLGGGGFESRLLTRIREERGLAYRAWSAFDTGLVGGTFTAGLSTQNATADEALPLLFGTMEQLQQQPVREQELADAKAFLVGNFPLNLASNRHLASIFTTIERFELGLDYLERFPELIRAVTRQDVQRVARQHLHPNAGVLVILADMDQAELSGLTLP